MARKRRRRRENKLGIMSISAVVLVLLIVISIKSVELHEKNEQYIQREEILTKERDAELVRQEELEEYSKYVKTKKYIEEIAKNKLGLVYKDEIIFRSKN